MSPALALSILQWAAIVVLYLGLAAVLRETRMLRGQVTRLQARLAADHTVPAVDLALPTSLTDDRATVVLVADTTCPSCAAVLERLAGRRADLTVPLVVLTWEEESAWEHLAGGLRVVRDPSAWSAVSHLTPPVLLRTASDGRVLDVHLPVGAGDVDTTLADWGALSHATSSDTEVKA